MKSILAKVAKARSRITPQNEVEFIVLQMAVKAGDPLLFRPYLRIVQTSSFRHCIDIFRRERKLPIDQINPTTR